MSEEEILDNDLRYIFELVRIHSEFNNPKKKKEKNEKVVDNTEKYIDEIIF